MTPALQAAQRRLAQHYLGKLKQANAAARRGPGSRSHWLGHIQQDWEQIKQWQAWSAARSDAEPEQARLCAEFALSAADILRIQLSPAEHLAWTQQALEGARRSDDRAGEMTLLYQVSFLSLTVEKLDQAEQYTQELMERAQAEDDDLGLGRAWYMRATIDFTRGVYDRAEEGYDRSIVHFKACAAPEEITVAWRGMGRLAQFSGRYQQAQDYYERYLHDSAAAGSQTGVLDAHMALSGVCLSLRDYAAAEQHAQQAFTLIQPFQTSRLYPSALLSLAHAEKWLGKYDSACAHYEEAIASARRIAPPSTVSNGLYGLGQARSLLGDPAAARSHLAEALDIARAAQLVLRVCEIAHDLVYVHIALDDLGAARARLTEALASARRIGTPHFLTKTLAAAATLWRAQGRAEQAALWAGLLAAHTQYLHPSLFDKALYDVLKRDLGAERYAQMIEQGQSLTLDGVIAEIAGEVGGFSGVGI